MTSTHVHVCVTCRVAGDAEARPGALMHAALAERGHAGVQLHKVECLSVCKRPCTVAVSAPKKWTYIIGGLDAQADVDALLQYVDAYAASSDGVSPFKDRPLPVKQGTIARLPPKIMEE